jgi:hypothetical protein
MFDVDDVSGVRVRPSWTLRGGRKPSDDDGRTGAVIGARRCCCALSSLDMTNERSLPSLVTR